MVYVVAMKPSARRTSAPVGRWVRDHGARRAFDSKPLAREWARAASGPRARVWIQDAVPTDASDADGYLVGRGTGRGRGRSTDVYGRAGRSGAEPADGSADRQSHLGSPRS
jgi:hypothetical protein